MANEQGTAHEPLFDVRAAVYWQGGDPRWQLREAARERHKEVT